MAARICNCASWRHILSLTFRLLDPVGNSHRCPSCTRLICLKACLDQNKAASLVICNIIFISNSNVILVETTLPFEQIILFMLMSVQTRKFVFIHIICSYSNFLGRFRKEILFQCEMSLSNSPGLSRSSRPTEYNCNVHNILKQSGRYTYHLF
jgi:hypothetical protein